MSPSFLQLQTQAGNGSQPISISAHPKSRSNDSINTLSSSSSSSSPKVSLDIVRCSRCQRSLSIDPAAPVVNSGAVRFGLNSYYCSRCANVVGFVKWSDWTEGVQELKTGTRQSTFTTMRTNKDITICSIHETIHTPLKLARYSRANILRTRTTTIKAAVGFTHEVGNAKFLKTKRHI